MRGQLARILYFLPSLSQLVLHSLFFFFQFSSNPVGQFSMGIMLYQDHRLVILFDILFLFLLFRIPFFFLYLFLLLPIITLSPYLPVFLCATFSFQLLKIWCIVPLSLFFASVFSLTLHFCFGSPEHFPFLFLLFFLAVTFKLYIGP